MPLVVIHDLDGQEQCEEDGRNHHELHKNAEEHKEVNCVEEIFHGFVFDFEFDSHDCRIDCKCCIGELAETTAQFSGELAALFVSP